MSFVFAWMLALAPAASSPAADRPAADGAVQAVAIDIDPPLVRSMELRLTVRRDGDDPVMHRPVDVLELPRPAHSDEPPAPVRLELPPGDYLIEAEAAGFLPSTRAVSVRPGVPVTVAWQLLPDSAHRTVRFSLAAGFGDAPVSLTARPLDGEQAPVGCTVRRAPCEFRLRPGAWELQAGAPGHRPLQRRVTVGDAATQIIDLSLETGPIDQPPAAAPATPVPGVPADGRRKRVLGLSLAAVPLLAAGLPLTVVGPVRYGQQRRSSPCDSYGTACAAAIIPPIHLGGLGAGLLGAALGLGATAITAARARTGTAWLAELGVGVALALGGGAWLIGNSVLLDRDLKTGPLADIDARAARRPAAAFFLGAGLGLAGGGLTGLLLGRSARAARLGPHGGPGHAGLLLSGEF